MQNHAYPNPNQYHFNQNQYHANAQPQFNDAPTQTSHPSQQNQIRAPFQNTWHNSSHPSAYMATQQAPMTQEKMAPNQMDSQMWHPDSGASHHLTSNHQNLAHSAQYSGSGQVHMGNGQGLSIHSIGSTKISSRFDPSITLTLNNLLHVPSITKNLMYVSKFAKDNGVFFEFHPLTCFVKS